MTPAIPDPLRVLVATNMFPLQEDPARGAFVRAQVESLSELGLAVEVFHIQGQRSTLNYAKAIFGLRRAVRRFDPDVVYAFYGLTGWVALWQPRPIVLSLAGDDVLGTPNGRGGITAKSRVGMVLSQWAAHRAAVVCVQSEQMRERLWGAGLRERALILPYGVDPRRFYPGDQGTARERLGLSLHEPLVIFPNTPTEPRKRLDLAEAAMELVRRHIPRATLLVVTRVPHKKMPDYYRAADCCLLTSDWEGSPNVVKEALLSGLPVVTTDVGDVRRWVPLSPESAVCTRTPEELAAAIIRVLRKRQRVDPTPFMSGFSTPAIARQMIRLLDQARVSHAG
jgi:glycosyltransferase involved in cell wall biosynthesis